MTKAALGYESALYINTGTYAVPVWTEIDLARDVKFSKAKDEIDATSRQSARGGWKAMADGLKSWSAEFDTLVPAAGETPNPAFAALEAAWYANTSVDVLRVRGGVVSDAGPLYAEHVQCQVLGGDEGEPLNDVATINFKLTNGSTVPVRGTTSSGTFTPA